MTNREKTAAMTQFQRFCDLLPQAERAQAMSDKLEMNLKFNLDTQYRRKQEHLVLKVDNLNNGLVCYFYEL